MATVVVDKPWVSQVREQVITALLGTNFGAKIPSNEILETFETLADWNAYVRDNWLDEGMDLNLNGDAPDSAMIPEGFVYPMTFGTPDDCFIEGVGADIM